MSEMTVSEKMDRARVEKYQLIKTILEYQQGNKYSLEDLQKKTLKQLREIYAKVLH